MTIGHVAPPERFPGIRPCSRSGTTEFYDLESAPVYRCPHCAADTTLDPHAVTDHLDHLIRNPVTGGVTSGTPRDRYEFTCSGCGLPVAVLGKTYENPPRSNRFMPAIHTVVETGTRTTPPTARNPGVPA